jgi:hypothetical protein
VGCCRSSNLNALAPRGRCISSPFLDRRVKDDRAVFSIDVVTHPPRMFPIRPRKSGSAARAVALLIQTQAGYCSPQAARGVLLACLLALEGQVLWD